MRFVIKYPTRGRPGQFIRQVQKYRAFLSRRNPVRFVVSIDEDDRTMHAADVKAFISRQRDMKVYVGASKGKIEAVNADFEKLGDYDVLILASDDMVLIDSWGYIYHPSYRSEFCDNEFQDVTERDGKSVKSPLCLFKHEWAKTGKDATFIRNSNLWCVDKPNYERRKAAGFPK